MSSVRPAAAAEARFAERIASRRRARLIKGGIGALVIVVLGAVGWVVCFSGVLAVKSVQVAGVERLSQKQVQQMAAVPRGGSLALLDTEAIADRVRSLVQVADVDVSRRFPNTVRIDVTERVPVAVLSTASGRRLIDAEGVAFAPAGKAAADLPVVATTRTELSRDALVEVQEMLRALPAVVRDQVRRVDADTEQDMVLALADDRRVVWGGPDSPAFKARVLELLYTEKSTRKSRVFDVSVPEAPVTRP